MARISRLLSTKTIRIPHLSRDAIRLAHFEINVEGTVNLNMEIFFGLNKLCVYFK